MWFLVNHTVVWNLLNIVIVDIDIGKLQNLSGKLQNSGKFRINATNDVEQISNNRVIINIMSVYILVRPETCFLLFIFSQGNELSFTCFACHELFYVNIFECWNKTSIYVFVYENGDPSSLCCGRSKIWCDKYIQSKINKRLNKLVFYLETKGKVVAFKQYFKYLLFI